jgi:hypothetical protein
MARRSLATASDQTVLILGSGLVARPCVEFLSRTRPVTLISAEAGQAEKLISTLPVGSQTVTPIHMDASDAEIERLVSEHDLTISLLPDAPGRDQRWTLLQLQLQLYPNITILDLYAHKNTHREAGNGNSRWHPVGGSHSQ